MKQSYSLLLTASIAAVAVEPTFSWGSSAPCFFHRQSPTVSLSSSLFATSSESHAHGDCSGQALSSSDPMDDFLTFLLEQQSEIIQQIEDLEASFGSHATFGNDQWGMFADEDSDATTTRTQMSGGKTRVLQGGFVVEKGACSLTVLRQGRLTAERAATIQSRQIRSDQSSSFAVQAGDTYSAVALSMVLHSKHPMVPTFRSDVRMFQVQISSGQSLTWLGGGADLTPYVLYASDIAMFHTCYRDLIAKFDLPEGFEYAAQKKSCDAYFYLPARQEHRGTGGIFFDDLPLTETSLCYVQGVVKMWMPSWFPIVQQRQKMEYTDREKQWQLLRRGRYLEFNLLYDRGVKFGLANANPRTEGVMVSAPPLIAFEYNHHVEPGSPEDELLQVLKTPRDWVQE